jgi:hypothetical protein
MITYFRVLDAEAEGADWREVSRIVLHNFAKHATSGYSRRQCNFNEFLQLCPSTCKSVPKIIAAASRAGYYSQSRRNRRLGRCGWQGRFNGEDEDIWRSLAPQKKHQ